MIKHLANIVTSTRLICCIFILFYPPFSSQFYSLYIYCGLSDMVDGTIARLTHSTSMLGSRLDSFADFLFVLVSLIKILPAKSFPKWVWIWTLIIFLIKIFNLASSYLYHKRILVEHTLTNKLAGLFLFLFPLSMPWIEIKYSAFFVCFIAIIAAIEEGYYIRKGQEIV